MQVSLSFKGQATKRTTVKWSIVILIGSSCKSQVNDRLEELEGVSTFTDFVQAFSQFGSDMVDLAHLSGDRQNVSCMFHFKLSFVFKCVIGGEPRNCWLLGRVQARDENKTEVLEVKFSWLHWCPHDNFICLTTDLYIKSILLFMGVVLLPLFTA